MVYYSAGNKEGWCIILQGIRRDGEGNREA